jgi:hypothetical protein
MPITAVAYVAVVAARGALLTFGFLALGGYMPTGPNDSGRDPRRGRSIALSLVVAAAFKTGTITTVRELWRDGGF